MLDPACWPSAEEVMQHPWFAHGRAAQSGEQGGTQNKIGTQFLGAQTCVRLGEGNDGPLSTRSTSVRLSLVRIYDDHEILKLQ